MANLHRIKENHMNELIYYLYGPNDDYDSIPTLSSNQEIPHRDGYYKTQEGLVVIYKSIPGKPDESSKFYAVDPTGSHHGNEKLSDAIISCKYLFWENMFSHTKNLKKKCFKYYCKTKRIPFESLKPMPIRSKDFIIGQSYI